jgi:hypothetical protein
MMMGSGEEKPVVPDTTTDDSGADDSGADDSGADDTEGGGGEEEEDQPAKRARVEYHWRKKALKKISVGVPFKSIKNKPLDACKQECENQEECSGFNRKRTGTKKCVFYSGDVSTSFDATINTYLLSRV